ncbi:MAG: hypothetical protein RIE32_09975 [Phycisphaerales bacterium]
MRVLTHPQHAGEPLPKKKPKAPRPVARPKAAASMKPAGKPKAPETAAALRPASNAASATAVAEKPTMPGSTGKPVEVFAPDRPAKAPVSKHDDPKPQDADLGTGPLMDDLDDSTLGLGDPKPQAESKPDPAPSEKAIERTPEPRAPEATKGPEIGEVVDLIEKLRTHVDAQGGRFDHAMGVLDQIRESAAALPEIRERIDTMLASIDELKANQFKGHEKVERALSAQSSRLDEIFKAIERATQREEKLAQSLAEINQTILAVSGTNDRLASAIDAMRRHEAERDARIGRALTGAQRWLIVLTLVMGVGMIATIITAVVAGG